MVERSTNSKRETLQSCLGLGRVLCCAVFGSVPQKKGDGDRDGNRGSESSKDCAGCGSGSGCQACGEGLKGLLQKLKVKALMRAGEGEKEPISVARPRGGGGSAPYLYGRRQRAHGSAPLSGEKPRLQANPQTGLRKRHKQKTDTGKGHTRQEGRYARHSEHVQNLELLPPAAQSPASILRTPFWLLADMSAGSSDASSCSTPSLHLTTSACLA
ncbi:hypothetical protein FB645_000239 [Coemansia sp. IMI 203386]|nr:hypothetical protein FB645_000239 [Coemansia sp. IMI 203386]